MAWWTDEAVLARYLTDLFSEELARLKPRLRLPPRPWQRNLVMDEAGLGIDSLDRLGLAASISSRLAPPENYDFHGLLALPLFGEWIDAAREWLAREPASVLFGSSGTTGEIKRICHDRAMLEQEAQGFARIIGPARRVMSFVPCHHIYGFLFTILLPKALGASVVDLRTTSPTSLTSLEAGDVIVSYPLAWQASLSAVSHWPQGVTGVSSTAPMPHFVAEGLRAAGLSRLIEVYGSTETAGVGWRDSHMDAFRLLPWWRRSADNEIERDGNGGVEWFRLPDDPQWHDAHHLTPGGRRDGQVQVGGINVSPDRVRAVLLTHDGVADVWVRLMRPDEGVRLKAFVVPRSRDVDAASLRNALSALVSDRLSAPERPTSFTFGPALPRSPLGKPRDWIIE